jgi:hypothetical protein
MITLGGYTLNPNMVWLDRDSWAPVIQTMKRTLGGKIVVNTDSLEKGRPITLSTLEDQGWLTYTQRNTVLQMAAIPGAVYALVIGSETFSVMFRHNEPPAVEFKPLIERAVPLAGDYFLGQIKLLEI